MFYLAEAFLAGKSLSFSKHSGVIAAFAQHFTQTKMVPEEFHRHLIRGLEIRHVGDYDYPGSVWPKRLESRLPAPRNSWNWPNVSSTG
jgi:uncharacterized protein (UPF0332 family)